MKICSSQGCTNRVFAKGYCKYHQYFRTDAKPKKITIYRIKPRSKKQLKADRKYSKLRAEFLSRPENERCAVYPWLYATEVHHKKGRGIYQNDTSTWLAVSREGHKWIEEHPEEAKEKGWSISRLGK